MKTTLIKSTYKAFHKLANWQRRVEYFLIKHSIAIWLTGIFFASMWIGYAFAMALVIILTSNA